QIGITTDENGHRVPEKGAIPDIDSVTWDGRTVRIFYDSNTSTNLMVAAQRRKLAAELERRGAMVYFVDLAPEPGVNGVDDYLALHGLDSFLALYRTAYRYDWHQELHSNEKGKIAATFGNALIALR